MFAACVLGCVNAFISPIILLGMTSGNFACRVLESALYLTIESIVYHHPEAFAFPPHLGGKPIVLGTHR